MRTIAATIRDVAKRSGLSTATISKYINGITVKEKNRVRIEEAIQSLGFKVNPMARGLKTNRTMTVGVLIPSLVNIFATSIVSQIERVLLQNGYSTIICDYSHQSSLEASRFDFLLEKNVDGIILIPLAIGEEKVKKAMEGNTPVVAIDRPIKDIECDVVLVDNLNASYHAVEQLITTGHRRIGIICGPQNVYTAQERLKGCMRVYEDYSLKVDETLLKFGDYEIQSGYDLMMELLSSSSPPTAVFVTNYEMTLGAVMALNEANRKIPEEISVIGFDNLQLARVVKPSLSIVMQPIQQIGESAANLILKRMKEDQTAFPTMLRLKTEWVAGQSIGDPPEADRQAG